MALVIYCHPNKDMGTKTELLETESKEAKVVYIKVAEGNCSNVSKDGVNRESRADSEHAIDTQTKIIKIYFDLESVDVVNSLQDKFELQLIEVCDTKVADVVEISKELMQNES